MTPLFSGSQRNSEPALRAVERIQDSCYVTRYLISPATTTTTALPGDGGKF